MCPHTQLNRYRSFDDVRVEMVCIAVVAAVVDVVAAAPCQANRIVIDHVLAHEVYEA